MSLSSARPLTVVLRQFYSTIAAAAVSQPPSPAVPETSGIEDVPRKSYLEQFRKNKRLTVSDLTSVEWCEKQMEFELLRGKSKETKAMKKGSDRHAQLEKESTKLIKNPIAVILITDEIQIIKDKETKDPIAVVTDEIQIAEDKKTSNPIAGITDKIQISEDEKTNNPILDETETKIKPKIAKKDQKKNKRFQLLLPIQASKIKMEEINGKSGEESWVLKFINSIIGINQLISQGLTRELPVMGSIEGVWIIGVIDEIRIYKGENVINSILIDTKTRVKPFKTTPAQKRNARFQMMCYKYLWDNLINNKFPLDDFFKYYDKLDPEYILSDIIKEHIYSLGFESKAFRDVVEYFKNNLPIVPKSKEELLLRYELQKDNSLIEEYKFLYDETWLKDKVRPCLDFWTKIKKANYVSKNEKWKCHFCKFSTICPNISLPANILQ